MNSTKNHNETENQIASHTPGPWRAISLNVWDDNGGERKICNCDVGPLHGYAEDEANARLIAAAPELLEALQQAEKRLAKYHERDPLNAGLDNTLGWVRAAIAKAQGGAS